MKAIAVVFTEQRSAHPLLASCERRLNEPSEHSLTEREHLLYVPIIESDGSISFSLRVFSRRTYSDSGTSLLVSLCVCECVCVCIFVCVYLSICVCVCV